MRTLRFTVLAASICAVQGCVAPQAPDLRATSPPPAECRRLADAVEKQLLEDVLPAWFPRCVDPAGGFYATFGSDWRRGEGNPKSVVYQARQTWVAATMAMAYPDLAATYRGYARHGTAFLRDKLWDEEHGGFFWQLSETVEKPTHRDEEKHLYGNAFAIYALARAHRATGDEAARKLAVRTFRWWERRAHDGAHGGYFEALTRDGRRIPYDADRPIGRRTSVIGALYGQKSMNAHIHMLEAITELYRVEPTAAVRRRLEGMLSVVREKIAVEPGCLNQFFTADWRPLPYGDSFGHDIETAFLLIEAAEALGRHGDSRTLQVARRLVDHALDYGWDDRHGGFYDEGTATSSGQNLHKIWWVQAEGLNALLLMHEHFGGRTDRYYRAFLKQWEFIDAHMADHSQGGWHATTTREGQPTSKDKASVWKAAYHNVRALLGTVQRLRRLAGAARQAE
jgi:mannobiose 2-epimerase